MATEYIGSRYVPKFTDNPESQWTNTVTYEPLTIVLYQGNSYTSRQFVPIGIDISNTDYWAETGNYNAQVEAYRQEVATFDSRITANTNNIATVLPLDTTPTQDSTKGATSGGIYTAINDFDYFFDTVADMQASTKLAVGDVAHTNGFYTSGDGGSANYLISDSGTVDNITVFQIANTTLYATLVPTTVMDASTVGISTEVENNGERINALLKLCNNVYINETALEVPITLDSYKNIHFDQLTARTGSSLSSIITITGNSNNVIGNKIINGQGVGINVTGGQYCNIDINEIYASSNGLLLDVAEDSIIALNTYHINICQSSTTDAILLTGSGGILDCVFEGSHILTMDTTNSNGLRIAMSGNGYSGNNTFNNMRFIGHYGIYIEAAKQENTFNDISLESSVNGIYINVAGYEPQLVFNNVRCAELVQTTDNVLTVEGTGYLSGYMRFDCVKYNQFNVHNYIKASNTGMTPFYLYGVISSSAATNPLFDCIANIGYISTTVTHNAIIGLCDVVGFTLITESQSEPGAGEVGNTSRIYQFNPASGNIQFYIPKWFRERSPDIVLYNTSGSSVSIVLHQFNPDTEEWSALTYITFTANSALKLQCLAPNNYILKSISAYTYIGGI